MSTLPTTKIMWGLFRCEQCGDDPNDDCGDWCLMGAEWAEEIPPMWTGLDMWPMCRCCGRDAQLIDVLVSASS